MKALVVSHRHHLLPVAWRLQQEGWEIDLIVDRDSYERAWKGKFDPKLRKIDKRSRQTMKAQVRLAEEGGYAVLTDSPKWNSEFGEYPNLFGFVPRPEGANKLPNIMLGGWFDGEEFTARHLLVEDQGLWPGGMGPDVPGGLTLIAPISWPEAFEVALGRVKDELKARGYRGLVKVGITLRTDPEAGSLEPELIGYQAGWNFLQTHAVLAEAGDFGTPRLTEILQGATPTFHHRYTVAIPVSIPPYPNRAATAEAADRRLIPIEAVKCGHIYWHDMLIEDGVMQTAGLDGLVGVVRASANSLMLARTQALGFARLINLPQLQVRLDVSSEVDRVLAMLEGSGVPI